MQALYQMEVAGKGINEILAEFETYWIGREVEGEQYQPAEIEFFRDILSGVLPSSARSIRRRRDAGRGLAAEPRRGRDARRLARRRLRAEKRKDVPARVVIKEYVDVAAAFSRATKSAWSMRCSTRWRARRAPED